MAILDTWLANAKCIRVEPSNLIPPFFLNSAALSSAELLTQSLAETDDGWPEAVVNRNHARRTEIKKVWVSPKGIAIGKYPSAVLTAGNSIKFLEHADQSKTADIVRSFGFPLREFPEYFYTEQVAIIQDCLEVGGQVGLGTQGPVTQASDVNPITFKRLVDKLVGVELAGGEIRFYPFWDAANARQAVQERQAYVDIEADSDANSLVVGLMFETSTAAYIRNGIITYKCPRPAALKGVSIILWGWPSAGDSLTNARRFDGFTGAAPIIHAIKAEPLWKELLSLYTTRSVVDAGAVWHMIGSNASAPQWTTTNAGKIFFVSEAVQEDDPLLIGPDRVLNGGFPGSGLTLHNAYVVGMPEMVEGLYIDGVTTFDAAQKVLSITVDRVSLDWYGDHILDLAESDELTAQERDDLIGTRIRSCILPVTLTVPSVLVPNLSCYQAAKDAGVDLYDEVFIEARNPGDVDITFREAEKRAKGKTSNIFHQMITRGDVAGVTHYVISGDASAPLEASIHAYKGLVDLGARDLGDLVTHIGKGGRATMSMPGMTLDEFLLATVDFGVTTFDTYKLTPFSEEEFDEATMFDGQLADPRLLSLGRRSGFYLMQFVHNRKTLTTIVAGAISYGKLARRRLTT